MKKIREQKIIKQIICIIIILMLCNFIVPNYSYAVETEEGGSLVADFLKLFCFIPDVVIGFLQETFTSPDGIYFEVEDVYRIMYSPGIIFSGDVPAFDINFINPGESKVVSTLDNTYSASYTKEMLREICNGFVKYPLNRLLILTYADEELTLAGDDEEKINKFIEDVEYLVNTVGDDGYLFSQFELLKESPEYKEVLEIVKKIKDTYLQNVEENYADMDVDANHNYNRDSDYAIYLKDEFMYIASYQDKVKQRYSTEISNEYGDSYGEVEIDFYTIENFVDISADENTLEDYKAENVDVEYKSSAQILQKTVATWYNALRRIALVGLLSALVYIGIRIVLSSTSAKDKAKYKKMFKDWLVALCILFTLHYIMNITIVVVDKINEVIKASSIAPTGEDILMTTLRNTIYNGDDWGPVITYIVIYCVLAVYTVIFTIQYIRRAIYLAFLTMIAPLITLTYPLDKIKDSKSQAFDMWIKDYIFFTLIQVVHLLLYYIFLGSSLDLASEGNWFFAIVAIGFLTTAEKFVKKMFGFEQSKTMGAMAAGATGAMIMNAINKVPKASGGTSSAGNGGSNASGAGSASSVRTASTNPLSGLITNTGGGSSSGAPTGSGSSGGASTGRGSSGGASTGRGSSGGAPTGRGSSGGAPTGRGSSSGAPTGRGSSGGAPTGRGSSGGAPTGRGSSSGQELDNRVAPKRNILNGVTTVVGKYFISSAKGSLKVLASGAGAIIGLSAAVTEAEGNISSAISGAILGATAVNNLSQNTVNLVQKISKDIPNSVNNVVDTWREGAHGEDYAQNKKFDREFRKSNAYKDLRRDFNIPEREFDEKIQQLLDSGITDSKKMKKILKNHKKHEKKYTLERAIAFHEMAEKCSDNILYDSNKFIKFCENKGIEYLTPEELEELRTNIIEFK